MTVGRARPWRLAGLLASLMLAACGTARTSSGNYSTFYRPSVVSGATTDGVMALVVRGNPFQELPQGEAEAAIARSLYLPGWFQQASFVPVTPAGARDQYRVALVFNAETPVSASAACGDVSAIPVTPPGEEVSFRAAFCLGDYVVSNLFGSSPAVPPDSPAFRKLMEQISYTLFPPYNPELRDDDDRFPFGMPLGLGVGVFG